MSKTELNNLQAQWNQVCQWLADTFVLLDQQYSLPKAKVYNKYLKFCRQEGLQAANRPTFGRMMYKTFPGVTSVRRTTKKKAKHHYGKLAFKPQIAEQSTPYHQTQIINMDEDCEKKSTKKRKTSEAEADIPMRPLPQDDVKWDVLECYVSDREEEEEEEEEEMFKPHPPELNIMALLNNFLSRLEAAEAESDTQEHVVIHDPPAEYSGQMSGIIILEEKELGEEEEEKLPLVPLEPPCAKPSREKVPEKTSALAPLFPYTLRPGNSLASTYPDEAQYQAHLKLFVKLDDDYKDSINWIFKEVNKDSSTVVWAIKRFETNTRIYWREVGKHHCNLFLHPEFRHRFLQAVVQTNDVIFNILFRNPNHLDQSTWVQLMRTIACGMPRWFQTEALKLIPTDQWGMMEAVWQCFETNLMGRADLLEEFNTLDPNAVNYYPRPY